VQPYPGFGPQAAPPPGPPPEEGGGRKIVRILAIASLVLALLMCVGTAVAGMMSESLGMTMAYVTAGPLGFGLVGTIAASMTKRSSSGVAIGVPLGCGCLSAFGLIGLVVTFFVAIFPSL
jgi:hypothetical protein